MYSAIKNGLKCKQNPLYLSRPSERTNKESNACSLDSFQKRNTKFRLKEIKKKGRKAKKRIYSLTFVSFFTCSWEEKKIFRE